MTAVCSWTAGSCSGSPIDTVDVSTSTGEAGAGTGSICYIIQEDRAY